MKFYTNYLAPLVALAILSSSHYVSSQDEMASSYKNGDDVIRKDKYGMVKMIYSEDDSTPPQDEQTEPQDQALETPEIPQN